MIDQGFKVPKDLSVTLMMSYDSIRLKCNDDNWVKLRVGWLKHQESLELKWLVVAAKF